MINSTVSYCSINMTFQHNSSLDVGKQYEIKIIALSHDGGMECDITPPNNTITTTGVKHIDNLWLLLILLIIPFAAIVIIIAVVTYYWIKKYHPGNLQVQ